MRPAFLWFVILSMIHSSSLAQMVENPSRPENPDAGRVMNLEKAMIISDHGKPFIFQSPRLEDLRMFQNIIPDEKEIAENIAPTGGFDFSAMDKIWEIISILERGEDPPENAWVDLIRTPVYASLVLHEHHYGPNFLRQNLRLVFKPSMADGLKKRCNMGKDFCDSGVSCVTLDGKYFFNVGGSEIMIFLGRCKNY